MPNVRLLLLSNSINYGGDYLGHAKEAIKDFLGSQAETVLLIPYAFVRKSIDEFVYLVRGKFEEMGYKLISIHEAEDPKAAVMKAEAIVVSGGNTFHLLNGLYANGLIDAVRSRVAEGIPYIGWSAGSNVACPTIKTTNDMPIIEPKSFDALGLAPFQINPHYTDERLPNHAGETRADRLAEFIEVNPGRWVVGLREGSMLRVEGSSITLLGDKSARIFIKGKDAAEYAPGNSLQFLLEN